MGAVAYLTQSQYGRNGHEIDINNSSSFITGNGGGIQMLQQISRSRNKYMPIIHGKRSFSKYHRKYIWNL